jgi:hypothetical protein
VNESRKKLTGSEDILKRLQTELGVGTKTDLANALGYKSVSAISNWKTRGIDWNRIVEKYPSLDVNYVKTGVRNAPFAREIKQRDKTAHSRHESRNTDQAVYNQEREILLKYLQEQAESLAKGLRRLSELDHSDDN